MRVGHSLFFAAALMVGSRPAWAECLPVEQSTEQVTAQYHEVPIAHAVQNGYLIVAVVSAIGKSFTVEPITARARSTALLPPAPAGRRLRAVI